MSFLERHNILIKQKVYIAYNKRKFIDKYNVIADNNIVLLFNQAKELALDEMNENYNTKRNSHYYFNREETNKYWDLVRKKVGKALESEDIEDIINNLDPRDYYKGYRVYFTIYSKEMLGRISEKEVENFTNKLKLNLKSKIKVLELTEKTVDTLVKKALELTIRNKLTPEEMEEISRIRNRFVEKYINTEEVVVDLGENEVVLEDLVD
jgi:hypothetical protein